MPSTQATFPSFPGDLTAVEPAALAHRVRLLEDYAETQARLDSADFDLEQFMQLCVDRLAEVTGVKGVVVELVEGDDMVYRAASPEAREHLGLRLTRADSLSGLCVAQREVLLCEDTETDPRVDREACRRVGVRSMLCAPLLQGDLAVGALKLMGREPSAFRAEDSEALALAAQGLGAALSRQLSYRRLSENLIALEREIEARKRLEVSLKANQTRLSNVIARAHQAIIMFNERGIIADWNPFAEQMFGWPAAEAIGRDAVELLIPAGERERRRDGMKRFLASTERLTNGKRAEWAALRRSGEAFPIEIGISAIQGPEGWEFIGLMQDISERRAQTALFETAFRHAAIGMALVGLDGGLLKTNPVLQALLGYPESHLLELDIQTITHPDDLQADLQLLDQLLAGSIPSYRVNKRYFRADGSEVWVRVAVALVRNADGSPDHFIAQVEDLTARREAELALKASETRYRLIAENATDMIVTTDLEGRTTFNTPACLPITGCPPEIMMGRRPLEFTHPDDVAKLIRVFTDLYNGGPSERVRWRSRHALEDRWVWLESNPSLQRHPETGAPMGFLDVVRDVTDQVAQEEALAAARAEAEQARAAMAESEMHYRLLAENTTDVIMRRKLSGEILYCSPAIRALGWEPEELVGLRAADLIHPDDRELAAEMVAGLVHQAPIQPARANYFRIRNKVGDYLWFEAAPSLIRDATGEPIELVNALRDVTARRAMEDELIEARRTAEAATAVKADFLANMSHEIRTPLTAVLGFSGLLSQRTDLDDEARHQVRRVSTASKALLSIVIDVLDFSKLEAGLFEIVRRPMSPRELAEDALAMFSPQADAKGLRLECVLDDGLPGLVSLDPDRTGQILLNLIGNAVKFTDAGAVRLGVSNDPVAQALHFEVEDTGPGLTAAQQVRLFQRFSQVDGSTTRKHGGTGLGLAICKGLTEAMGGQIGVRSQPGEGSVFYFCIHAPPAAEWPTEPQTSVAPSVDLGGIRVLVIDDNAVMRELARAALESFGVEVTEAEDGPSGVEETRFNPVDLILLDLNMPGMNGAEALLQIRESGGPNQSVPILAFTADADLSRLGVSHGFAGIVRKPIVPVELIARVNQWARWDGAQDGLPE